MTWATVLIPIFDSHCDGGFLLVTRAVFGLQCRRLMEGFGRIPYIKLRICMHTRQMCALAWHGFFIKKLTEEQKKKENHSCFKTRLNNTNVRECVHFIGITVFECKHFPLFIYYLAFVYVFLNADEKKEIFMMKTMFIYKFVRTFLAIEAHSETKLNSWSKEFASGLLAKASTSEQSNIKQTIVCVDTENNARIYF